MREEFLKDLVIKNRSARSFDGNFKLELDDIFDFVDTARLTASAVNRQPLKYFVTNDKEKILEITNSVVFGGGFKGLKLPGRGNEPSAYVVICADKDLKYNDKLTCIDLGIASQTLVLAAAEKGISSCSFGSFNEKKIRKLFNIKENLEILLAIALGKSIEHAEIVEIEEGESTSYYRENGIHFVPKRKLKDIIIVEE